MAVSRQSVANGLILRSLPFREKDRIVSVWTEERGLIRVLAQGALLVANRMVVLGQNGILVRFWLARGRELDRVTDFRVLWIPIRIRTDWRALLAFETMAEVVEGAWLLETPEAGLLADMIDWLRVLEEPETPPDRWLADVLRRLLQTAGFFKDEREGALTGLEGMLSLWEQNLERTVRSRRVWMALIEQGQRQRLAGRNDN